jgi:hypothetical protein
VTVEQEHPSLVDEDGTVEGGYSRRISEGSPPPAPAVSTSRPNATA